MVQRCSTWDARLFFDGMSQELLQQFINYTLENPAKQELSLDKQQILQGMIRGEEVEVRRELEAFVQRFKGVRPFKEEVSWSNDIERILGREGIEACAKELGLNRIKVPRVRLGDKEGVVTCKVAAGGKIEILEGLYAEKVIRVERGVTREEMKELRCLCETLGYNDLNWDNVIIAEDGLYIVDTERASFIQPITVRQGLERLIQGLSEENKRELVGILDEKLPIEKRGAPNMSIISSSYSVNYSIRKEPR